ncbi:MAG: gliding motility protein GldM [Marinilabiliaceae bacterium]
MSGGNCPETPRQKMIGMMYLFLTAMLALNVSGELLNAFTLVDESIRKTIDSMEKKNDLLYADFQSAYANNEAKVRDRYNEALEVQQKADSLYNHIQDLKTLIVQTADGEEATPTDYTSVSNQDVAAQRMITEKGGERSEKLKEHMRYFRDEMKGMVDEADTALINTLDRTMTPRDPEPGESGEQVSWESEKFEHLPMSATMGLMSQIQSEVRNVESDMVRYLYGKIDEGSFRFNSIEPLVIPKSDYIIKGDEYYAEIMLAARDTTQPPVVTVDGEELPVEQGRGILRIPANSTGEKEWSGEIAVMGPDGSYQRYDVSDSYLVAQPNVVISPTKMNVFYQGVENPVEVSVPGIPSEDLEVSITNADYTKDGNQFLVSPNSGTVGRRSVVSVQARVNGEIQDLGSQEFRIRGVPDPVATVAGERGGTIDKGLLMAQDAVIAKMENFEFDMSFKVTGFTVGTIRDGYMSRQEADGARFTQDQKDLIDRAAPGSQIIISNIMAQGPDGRTRDLGSITFTLR